MVKATEGYKTPVFEHEIDLPLNANESVSAIPDLPGYLASLDVDFVQRYPDHQALQDAIGDWVGVDAERIVVTAGGDESIDRIMRTMISETRNEIVTHAPTFEMIRIYAGNYDGQVVNVPWLLDEFPANAIKQQIRDSTAVVVLTTPNNPTGRTIDLETVLAICKTAAASGAKVLVDHAYVEFADEDTTQRLATEPNVMLVRTFSKAWGLAGLRVGYLIAPDVAFADMIRNAAGPFPVSAVSLQTALHSLTQYEANMRANVATINSIRGLMFDLLAGCGGQPVPSGGNYLFCKFEDVESVWAGLAEDGIGVRKFVGRPEVAGYLRITSPSNPGDYLRLAESMCRIAGIDSEPFKIAAGVALKHNLVIDEPTPESAGDTALPTPSADARTHALHRETKETNIRLELNLDGSGNVKVETGIGFLDHMLTALAFHSGIDLELICQGDLHVDDHHTAEDCAIALGVAIDAALGPRKGIKRFGYAYAPLDEALARTVIDLSGRPWPEVNLQLERPMIGTWACENITHFFHSLAMTLKCSLHVDVLRGTNDHHRAEAAFKSLAKALKEALTKTEGDVPSTKGVL